MRLRIRTLVDCRSCFLRYDMIVCRYTIDANHPVLNTTELFRRVISIVASSKNVPLVERSCYFICIAIYYAQMFAGNTLYNIYSFAIYFCQILY